jgi:DNA-binding transcriptional regulator YhcF (GntR family)
MRFHLDRTLPVPVAVQLSGQIEYAVACGELAPGQRLPTVRDLAAELAVSPVTVSAVYRSLSRKGLVVARVGDGTYVSDDLAGHGEREMREAALDRALDQLLRVVHTHGVPAAELLHRLQLRQALAESRALRVLFVGVFEAATRAYADHAATALGPGDTVDAVTLDELRRGTAPLPLATYDAVLTIGYHVAEVEILVAGAAPVAAVPFVPSEETRTRLARLQPGDRVLVIATYRQFLGVLKASVVRYAPHAQVVAAETAAAVDLPRLLGRIDAVVYATGSESITHGLPRGLRAFEYRHVPDIRNVAHTVHVAAASAAAAPALEP